MDSQKLIDRIKNLAKERGIKLKFICSKLGVAESYLGNVKSGRDRMTPERLEIIAEILGVSPQYLSGESEEQKAGLDFTSRLEELLNEKNITKIAFLTDLGYSKNAISEWRNGITKSYMNKIDQIADILDCSVDYLLGREQKKEAPSPIDMDKRKARLIEIYDSMPDDESKDKLLQVVVSFERVNKYEIESQYIGGIAAKGGNKPIIKQIPHKDK